MMKGPPDELARPLGPSGRFGELFGVLDEKGACPVETWLYKQPYDVQARYRNKFKRMCDFGPTSLRGDDWHGLKEKGIKRASALFEFKDIASKSRIFGFFDGTGVVLLTHGFGGKKEDKTPDNEILRGLRLMDSYLNRMLALQAGPRRTQR